MNKFVIISKRLFLTSVALLIVYLSHQPSLKPPVEWFPGQDKVFHLVEFGGLGLALVLNEDLFGKKHRKFRMVFSGVIWAVMDEFLQSFVPGRDSSFQDVFADIAGLFLAVWLFSRIFIKRKPHT